jgi:hypothetical protein
MGEWNSPSSGFSTSLAAKCEWGLVFHSLPGVGWIYE